MTQEEREAVERLRASAWPADVWADGAVVPFIHVPAVGCVGEFTLYGDWNDYAGSFWAMAAGRVTTLFGTKYAASWRTDNDPMEC